MPSVRAVGLIIALTSITSVACSRESGPESHKAETTQPLRQAITAFLLCEDIDCFEARKALAAYGDDAVLSFGTILSNGLPADAPELNALPAALLRRRAAEALGTLGNPSAIPVLLDALEDPDPLIRSEAARAISLIDAPSNGETLVKLLEDPDALVRATSAAAIATSGRQDLLPQLRAAADSEQTLAVRIALDNAISTLERDGARVPLQD
jgi:HEAT repeat protein